MNGKLGRNSASTTDDGAPSMKHSALDRKGAQEGCILRHKACAVFVGQLRFLKFRVERASVGQIWVAETCRGVPAHRNCRAEPRLQVGLLTSNNIYRFSLCRL